ncbi:MAG: efflux transporter outer membrane subunit [Sulfuritalea sp.]|nr:efflux transporter outer membrane subunit [Sulfuritalea sp.]
MPQPFTPDIPRTCTYAFAIVLALFLSACESLLPAPPPPPSMAQQWLAPLPHQGSVGVLSQWWKQQGDPLLVSLIEAAQRQSPTVAKAATRIEEARANQALASSALVPNFSAQIGSTRGVSQVGVAVATSSQAAVVASWELDLVGANSAVSRASVAQVEGSQAQWHEARVSVAAEVANAYFSLFGCRQMQALAQSDALSHQETARLVAINAKAGFVAESVAALARATAADSNSRWTQQTGQCEILTKSLVVLAAMPEAELKARLQKSFEQPKKALPIAVPSVPAQTITQRPDVYSAERDLVVAAAQVGSAKAQRLPRLSLNGSIGALRVGTGGVEQDESTWAFGPLTLSLPLFDAGRRAAAVTSSESAYQSAIVAYQFKVRNAVREVEEALVNLHSSQARETDAQVASQGYGQSLAATQARFNQGIASLVELEDARRNAFAAQSAWLALQMQRNLAWVALYRALGGGFEPQQSNVN